MDMAKSFEAKTGIKVEVIPVEEKDLGSGYCCCGYGQSSRCNLSYTSICFTLGRGWHTRCKR